MSVATLAGRKVRVADLQSGDRVSVGFGLGVRTVDYVAPYSGPWQYAPGWYSVVWCETSEATGERLRNGYWDRETVLVLS